MGYPITGAVYTLARVLYTLCTQLFVYSINLKNAASCKDSKNKRLTIQYAYLHKFVDKQIIEHICCARLSLSFNGKLRYSRKKA